MSESESIPDYKFNPMPVSSFIQTSVPKEGDELDLTVQVGAYYYSQIRSDSYEVVRLLESRADSCHFQVIGVIDSLPTLEMAIGQIPTMLHIPLGLEYFFSAQLVYMGTAPLTDEDFLGYRLYLEDLEWSEARIDGTISDLIGQSKEKPMSPEHMTYHYGEVVSRY